MFCMNCGKELPNTAKFCPFCGSKMGEIKTGSNFNGDSVKQSLSNIGNSAGRLMSDGKVLGLDKHGIISLALLVLSAIFWMTKWIHFTMVGNYSIFNWHEFAERALIADPWMKDGVRAILSLPAPAVWFSIPLVFMGVAAYKLFKEKEGSETWCGYAIVAQIFVGIYFLVLLQSLKTDRYDVSGDRLMLSYYISIALLAAEVLHLTKFISRNIQ